MLRHRSQMNDRGGRPEPPSSLILQKCVHSIEIDAINDYEYRNRCHLKPKAAISCIGFSYAASKRFAVER